MRRPHSPRAPLLAAAKTQELLLLFLNSAQKLPLLSLSVPKKGNTILSVSIISLVRTYHNLFTAETPQSHMVSGFRPQEPR